jgi:hypothetical protein
MCPECGGRCYSRKTKTPEWRCRKCGHECDEQDLVDPAKPKAFDPVLREQIVRASFDEHYPKVLGTDEYSQRIWSIGRKMLSLSGTYSNEPYSMSKDFQFFVYLFKNRGRTVTYAELYEIEFGREMPSDPNHIASNNGFEWAHMILDQRMANIRKKVEQSPQNPKIILKRHGSGYTIPDTGQTPWNDEGPMLERHQVVAIRRVFGDIFQSLGILILFLVVIVVAIVLVLLYLTAFAYR